MIFSAFCAAPSAGTSRRAPPTQPPQVGAAIPRLHTRPVSRPSAANCFHRYRHLTVGFILSKYSGSSSNLNGCHSSRSYVRSFIFIDRLVQTCRLKAKLVLGSEQAHLRGPGRKPGASLYTRQDFYVIQPTSMSPPLHATATPPSLHLTRRRQVIFLK
jgi:hypothetical protein